MIDILLVAQFLDHLRPFLIGNLFDDPKRLIKHVYSEAIGIPGKQVDLKLNKLCPVAFYQSDLGFSQLINLRELYNLRLPEQLSSEIFLIAYVYSHSSF